MTDRSPIIGLRIAHPRIAHHVANPEVGNPEIHKSHHAIAIAIDSYLGIAAVLNNLVTLFISYASSSTPHPRE